MFNNSHKELCSDRGCDSCRDLSENVDCTYISSNIKRAKPCSDSNNPVDQKKKRLHDSGALMSQEKKAFIDMFTMWSSSEQVDFICHLLSKISHFQQSQINHLLEPLLKRDFILALQSRGVPYLAEMILVQLDATSLLSVELVSRGWQWSVAKYQLWRRLLVRRLASDPVWHGLCERRGWLDLINLADPALLSVMLERRRQSMGLRQKMTEFPMFLDSTDLCAQSKVPSSSSQLAIVPSNLACHCQLGASTNPSNLSSLRVSGSGVGTSAGKPHPSDLTSPTPLHTQRSSISASHDLDLDSTKMPCCSTAVSNEPVGHHSKLSVGNMSLTMDTEPHDSASAETMMFAHRFYKQLYPRIIRDIKRVEENWIHGNYRLTRIPCRSDITKGVYCLQYDKEKIVSGLRDDTIKVWRRIPSTCQQASKSKTDSPGQSNRPDAGVGGMPPNEFEGANDNRGRGDGPVPDAAPAAAYGGDGDASNPESCAASATSDGYHCTQVIEGHSGSVLCLQYIGDLLISGSSDTTVRLWDLSTGCCLNIICHHTEAVLHLRFRDNVLVTCSKDRSIAVWDMGPWPKDVQLRQVLVGHRAAVNVVDFDEKYIVSASGDRTIKVWATDTCAYVRTLTGHRRGIACLQYRDRIVVSGSSDNTIRIWDIETGVCFRVLEGHEELVRCIRFDSKRIVSGAYDGKIKVWNLKAALNPRSKPNQLCIRTLQQHTGRVFRLQFDDFQIVSSSHDDTILIWDFARSSAGSEERDDGFDDGINAAVLASQSNCLCGNNMRQLAQGQPNSDANVQDLC